MPGTSFLPVGFTQFNSIKISKVLVPKATPLISSISAEIEEIRGVAFGTNTLEILMELNWVKPTGRKDVPGKPIQYGTTDEFLNHFSLQKLSDLPTVDELGSAGLLSLIHI